MLPYKLAGCQQTLRCCLCQETVRHCAGGSGDTGHEAKVDTVQETPCRGGLGGAENEAKVLQ